MSDGELFLSETHSPTQAPAVNFLPSSALGDHRTLASLPIPLTLLTVSTADSRCLQLLIT